MQKVIIIVFLFVTSICFAGNEIPEDFKVPINSQIIDIEPNLMARNISFYYDIPDENNTMDGIWDVVVFYPLIDEGMTITDISTIEDDMYEVCNDFKSMKFIEEFKKYNHQRQIIDESDEFIFDRINEDIVISRKPSSKYFRFQLCSTVVDKKTHWLIYNDNESHQEVYFVKKEWTGYRYAINQYGDIQTVTSTFKSGSKMSDKYYDKNLMDMSNPELNLKHDDDLYYGLDDY